MTIPIPYMYPYHANPFDGRLPHHHQNTIPKTKIQKKHTTPLKPTTPSPPTPIKPPPSPTTSPPPLLPPNRTPPTGAPPRTSSDHRNTPILATLAFLSSASRTVGFHLDRRPDFAAGAGALDQSGGGAEGGEDGLGVAAGVGVGVVFAHCCWLCRGLGMMLAGFDGRVGEGMWLVGWMLTVDLMDWSCGFGGQGLALVVLHVLHCAIVTVCCLLVVFAVLSRLIDRMAFVADAKQTAQCHSTPDSLYTPITIHYHPSVCLEITIKPRKTYLFFVVTSQSKQMYNLPQRQPNTRPASSPRLPVAEMKSAKQISSCLDVTACWS